MKIMTVFGTRPEAIKMAPVVRALHTRAQTHDIQVRTCTTGQHREMVAQVTRLFDIAPDIDLDLMQAGQTPSQVAARILCHLDPMLATEHPDWVLVQGDTTTVMATAIAAYHRQIRIGHVEAGLRTGDRYNPFPEEMNRVTTDHYSDLNFAPTLRAQQNLLNEGIPAARIRVTGNTVIDALHWVVQQPCDVSHLPIHNAGQKVILVTAHRRESFGQPLHQICTALNALAHSRRDVQIVFPVHPNPQVRETVHAQLDHQARIALLPPLDYPTLIHVMQRSTLILTDSGGIQEEAPSLGKPVLVLREQTERPEAVAAGAARLVGTDPERILAAVHRLLDDDAAYTAMAQVQNPYGDGQAAVHIVDAILQAGCR